MLRERGSAPKSLIDEIVREGARRMLAAALEAEVAAYVGQFVDERDEAGRRLVVRNGRAEPRQVLTSAAESFGDAQAVDGQQRDQRVLGRGAESGRDQQRPDLVAVQPDCVRLVIQP